MPRLSEIVVFFICIFCAVSLSCALNCYRCGKYTPDGAGSITPCYDYDDSHLQECRKGDQFCLKYLNEGIIVRDCAKECKTGVHELSEFFCCQEDGCNGASYLSPAPISFAFVLVAVYTALWNQ